MRTDLLRDAKNWDEDVRLKREFTVRTSDVDITELLIMTKEDLSRMRVEFNRAYEELF